MRITVVTTYSRPPLDDVASLQHYEIITKLQYSTPRHQPTAMIVSQIRRMKEFHVGSEICLDSDKESLVEMIGMVRDEEDAIYRSTSETFYNFAEASVYENPKGGVNGGFVFGANRRVESSFVIESDGTAEIEEESSLVKKKKRVAGLGNPTVVDRVNAALDEVLITLLKPGR